MFQFNKDIIINTKLGKVRGNKLNHNNKEFFLFKGIPYAHPPIYSLRWKPPILWRSNYPEDIYDATVYKDRPFELRDFKRVLRKYLYNTFNSFNISALTKYFTKYVESEDCLYLNILTPICERDRIPVIVYLPDTMFHFNNNDDEYLNRDIVDKDVIVITFNYRMGVFGFYYHKELDKENKSKISGNYGIQDVACALRWIRDNIVYYGGDPDNITLMGDGAGANIAMYLICNRKNEGLFHKAILNSFSFIYNLRKRTSTSVAICDQLVGQGKNQILRLRKVSAVLINDRYKKLVVNKGRLKFLAMFGPIVDHTTIIDEPYTIFKNGLQMRIPIIIGKNRCDGDFFFDNGFRNILRSPIHDEFFKQDNKLDKLKFIYPHIEKNSVVALKRYFDDFMFTMPLYMIANYHKINNKVYIYEYTHERDLIEGFYGCSSLYLNNNQRFFTIKKPAHDVFVDYVCEFAKSNIDLFTSFTMRDNSIWKECKTGFIIELGRASSTKKVKFNTHKLLEDRYVSKLILFDKIMDNRVATECAKEVITSIIRKISMTKNV